MTSRQYYAIEVAAAASGVKPRTIERWIRAGVISPLVTDGVRYVTLEQVEAAPAKAKRHGYANLARSLTDRET